MNKMPRWGRLLLAAMVVAVGAAGCLFVPVFSPRTLPTTNPYVIVRQGTALTEIVNDLHRQRLIDSVTPVIWVAKFAGMGRRLKAGGYRLNRRMSPYQILRKIESGKVDLQPITFPEGFTIDQIAERLQAKGMGNAGRFRSLAFHPHGRLPIPSWLSPGSLEGFLFPDTYLLPLLEPEEKVLGRMLRSFDQVVVKPRQVDFAASPLNLKEIVTLASLVEREARVPEERPLIAGVLVNRLRQGKRLECDATIQYALGRHKKRLLYADLKVDSPYNTYLHAGLPPGPISNPGLDCIEAALHPAKTDFLFYVAKPDGHHLFSRSLEEHLNAVRRIRRMKATARQGGAR